MSPEDYEQVIPRRAFVPFSGYLVFVSLTVEFFEAFGAQVTVRRSTIMENTALYFFLGAFTVLVTQVLPLLHPLFPLLSELVIAGCLAAAVFEVDFMVRYPDSKLLGIDFHWQNWKIVPRGVALTSGRRLVALGMYHATIFLLLGMTLAFFSLNAGWRPTLSSLIMTSLGFTPITRRTALPVWGNVPFDL